MVVGRAGKLATSRRLIALGIDPVRRFSTDQRWLATARGRLGYAADRWMWYVTGGAAWSGFDVNDDAAAAGHVPMPQAVRIASQLGSIGAGSWASALSTPCSAAGR